MKRRDFVLTGAVLLAGAPLFATRARADLAIAPPPRLRVAAAGDNRVRGAGAPERIQVSLTNESGAPMAVRVSRVVLIDPSGMRVPISVAAVERGGRPAGRLQLAAGQSETLTVSFASFPGPQAGARSWVFEVNVDVEGAARVQGRVTARRA